MRNKSLYLIFFIALGISFLQYSCANIRSLTGGEKDTTPPKDSVYFPINFSTNFTSTDFSIEFDEYINLNDINNQLIVSPPLNRKPKVTVKKKTVFVSFEDTLIPNTTYIFNFGNGIVDYTEGNPAKNLSYVFSTGEYLDSLSISGSCFDAFSNEPLEGVKVMLYNQDIDSFPLTQKPFYFGVTDNKGGFSVPYMKEGNYKVFCLEDDNGNYLYDEEEKMGFLDELTPASVLDSLQQSISIQMSTSEPEVQAILDQKTDSSGFVVLSFVKKPKDLAFEVLDLEAAKFTTETTQDSTYFWITASANKDKIFKLVVTDEGELLDTLYLLYYPEEKTKIDWIPNTRTTAIAVDSAYVFETFHTQLKTIDNIKFSLKEDSLDIPVVAVISSKSNRKVEITGDFEESKKYQLEILPNAITSLNGVPNDTLRYNFKTNSASNYGSIVVTLTMADSLTKNYLLQLVDAKNNLVFQERLKGVGITIPRLEAKKYGLRLIEDKNQNNRWDAGNYATKNQPEKCINFQDEIQVKPNWVMEYEWKIEE